MNKKRKKFSIGTSSVLVILIVLCLVSFSTLSIISANADYKLSEKLYNRTLAYYEACNRAEETLDQIDTMLHTIFEEGISRADYFEKVGTNISFVVPISDIQSLQIELTILYPKKDNQTYYEIKSWQVITTGELDYDETLTLPTQKNANQ